MWNRNFIMILVGQIISLFGNGILRFALPLYLLNETGSAALFGVVTACAFIPMIVLGPIGGILADRVNKRNIMVILDFSTALLVLGIILLLGKMNLVVLLLCALFILYGINGAYQPAVQASIPALLSDENIMKGNAAINLVSSLAGLLGPVLGGMLFGFYGIMPILYVSIGCFLASAVMEIFIQIPFEKKPAEGNIFAIGYGDLKESFRYMRHEQPVIMEFSLAVAAINMVLSALVIIGLPVIITQMLDFDSEMANTLYGYSEGVYAVGSLCGGMGGRIVCKQNKAEKRLSSASVLRADTYSDWNSRYGIDACHGLLPDYSGKLLLHGSACNGFFHSNHVVSADDSAYGLNWEGNILCNLHWNVCISNWSGCIRMAL